jgi:hypothetical protein
MRTTTCKSCPPCHVAPVVHCYRPILIPCATVTSGQRVVLNNKIWLYSLIPQLILLERSLLAFHSPHTIEPSHLDSITALPFLSRCYIERLRALAPTHTSTCCFTGHILEFHQDGRGSTLRARSCTRITAFCRTLPRPLLPVEPPKYTHV